MTRVTNFLSFVFRGLMLTILSVFMVGLICAMICGSTLLYYINSVIVPSAGVDLSTVGMNFTSIIYAQDPDTGMWIEYEEIQTTENRIWADLEVIPEDLQNAVVAIEDKRFYTHDGVDWTRTAGAVLGWVTGSTSYGGSTITQQLIKNVTGDNEVAVKRKITEIFSALELEKEYDKDRILELYLNTIYLGNNSYGVGTGATTYFSKELSELTLAECAALAGITNNPSLYNPFRYPDNVKERQETILYEMYDQGMISEIEYKAAVAEELVYQYDVYQDENSEPYSYFTDTIYRDVAADLAAAEGISEDLAKLKIQSGGLRIYATIDLDVQAAMDEVYSDDSNFPNASINGKLPESAMVVCDRYGNILGIVGGRGEKTSSLSFNRATQSIRQPGSSIKPVAVYAPAMDAGLITPYSVISNSPFMVVDGSAWPRNDNRVYSGQTLILTAVQSSINAVAVRVLDMLGVEESYAFLTEQLDYSNLTEWDMDYSPLALGGTNGGVTVREMAAAYTIFINDGEFDGSRTYTLVTDSNGNVLLDNQELNRIVFQDESTVYYMREVMQRVTASGTATGAKVDGMETAGKTGTTTSNNDKWFCGYTPYYVGATWMGYDTTHDLSAISGNYSTSLWTAVMQKIHENKESASFEDAPTLVPVSICLDSGCLATEYCSMDTSGSRVSTAYFMPGDQPTTYCDMHKLVEFCSESGLRASENCPDDCTYTASVLDLTRMFPIYASISDSYRCYTIENAPIGTGDVVISGGTLGWCTLTHYAEPETPSIDEWFSNMFGGSTTSPWEDTSSSTGATSPWEDVEDAPLSPWD